MANSKDPRVLFAAERTLLAWNRTSLALMAFGFLIERSGLLLRLLTPNSMSSASLTVTLWCGLGFILVGVFSAIYSCKQYADVLKLIQPSDIPTHYSIRWGIVVNGVVAIMGMALVIGLYTGH